MDPDPCIGAVRHQQADHVAIASQHGLVQRPMLVASRCVHVDDLGTRVEQILHAGRHRRARQR
jgi:hypothetical protein